MSKPPCWKKVVLETLLAVTFTCCPSWSLTCCGPGGVNYMCRYQVFSDVITNVYKAYMVVTFFIKRVKRRLQCLFVCRIANVALIQSIRVHKQQITKPFLYCQIANLTLIQSVCVHSWCGFSKLLWFVMGYVFCDDCLQKHLHILFFLDKVSW